MQSDKSKSKTPQDFFSHAQVSSNSIADNAFRESLRHELNALYLNNFSNRETPQNRMSKVFAIFRNKTVIGLTASLTVLAVVGAVVLLGRQATVEHKDPVVAKLGAEVIYAEGTIEYFVNDEWVALSNGQQIEEGDTIRSQEDARAIVNIDDGSAVRIDHLTEIKFLSLDPQDIKVELLSGSAYARVVKLDRDFSLATEDAEYFSLGTAYQVSKSTDEEGLLVYESKVKMNKKQGKELVVEEGNGYSFKKGEQGAEGEKFALDIEEIKKNEFALWNREKDIKIVKSENQLGILKDITPPVLAVDSPADNFETQAATIDLSGSTEAGARVFVNGNEVENNQGSFSAKIDLVIGSNIIKIGAKDAVGNYAEKKITVVRKTQPTVAPTQKPFVGIKLSGSAVADGIQLNWTVSGLNASEGFKLVRSLNPNPTYPADNPKYFDGGKSSAKVGLTDGKTYHFRVCRYNSSTNSCDSYSNNVTITAPNKASAGVSSIDLFAKGGAKVGWTVNGSSSNGFKVVWSKVDEYPTYPTGASTEASHTFSSTFSIYAFDGSGDYCVRVCAYNSEGVCEKYSNKITVSL